jgi:hypothetical protein
MSYNAWLYVYANPINLTDPSGHDPYWCEGRTDEKACFARWGISHGGKLDKTTLKAVYDINPDDALDLVRQQFDIQLPPGYQFRFAFVTGKHFSSNQLIPPTAGGANPWFYSNRWSEFPNASVMEWLESQGEPIMYMVVQCNIDQGDYVKILQHIDYSVYITDLTFTVFDFYPDDVAGVMIHEGTHAWQESLAVQQLGENVKTTAWFAKYFNGLERQAIDRSQAAHDSGRIRLSGDGSRRQISNYRGANSGGLDSPIVLPEGKP